MPPSADAAAADAARSARRRWATVGGWTLAVLVALLLASAVAHWVAAQRVRQHVLAWLGPQGSVQAVGLGVDGIVLQDVRVAADGDWPALGVPAGDALHVDRVQVRPVWSSLLRQQPVIDGITLDGATLTLVRTRDGRLHGLVPPLPGTQAGGPAPTGGPVQIAALAVTGPSRIVLHDLRAAGGAHSLTLDQLAVRLGPLAWPAAAGRGAAIDLDARGRLLGTRNGQPAPSGTVLLTGQAQPDGSDTRLQLRLNGVDLPALQPHLARLKGGLGGSVQRGTLDLALAPHLQGNKLHAPGHLRLTGVQIHPESLAGLQRQAVLDFLKHNERIEVDVVVDGRLDDPAFSFEDRFSTRVVGALGEKIGAGLGGVTGALEALLKGLFGG